MRRILYLSAASSYSHSLPAYGCLRALAERRCPGWEWALLERLTADNPSQTAVAAAAANPDLLIATTYLFNRNWLLEVIGRLVLLAPACRIILGGPEFLGDNKAFLAAHPEVDAVVRGDESALPRLLEQFDQKASWTSIAGVCMIDGNGVYADGGIARIEGLLDELPSPYQLGYFSPQKPFQHYETSRGCASRCAFCASAMSAGTAFHSLERVASDMAVLAAAGCAEIRILDRTFNELPSRAADLITLFATRFSHIAFHLEIDPARVTSELVDAFAAAQGTRFHLEAGVQSLSVDTLKAVGRPVDPSKIETGLRQLTALPNVEVHADLIAGLPGQTEEQVRRDAATLTLLGVEEIQLELLKVLPGTPLAERPPPELKWSPTPPYEVLSTATMDPMALMRSCMISKMLDAFHNFIGMRQAFRFATFRNQYFFEEFTSFIFESFSARERPSPMVRFKLLKKYAEERGDEALRAVVDFSALMHGYRTVTGVDPVNSAVAGELLWRREHPGSARTVSRMVVEFPCEAYDAWLNPAAPPRLGACAYLFEYPRHSDGAGASAVYLQTAR